MLGRSVYSCITVLINYLSLQVRIDDCVKALKEYVEKGKTFDYVINDLTDIPIAVSLHGKGRTVQVSNHQLLVLIYISRVKLTVEPFCSKTDHLVQFSNVQLNHVFTVLKLQEQLE